MPLPQLKRIRWAVRATLMLGVAASVAANVLHAQPNPISQAISAWPPLALLLTVELTSRIPMQRRGLSAVRVLATVVIAGIAAWVSYWHMQGVAVKFGESQTSSYLLPISVDGLIVVASVSLVELAGRIRVAEEQKAKGLAAKLAVPAATAPAPQPVASAPAVAPTQVPTPAATPAPAPVTTPAPAPTPVAEQPQPVMAAVTAAEPASVSSTSSAAASTSASASAKRTEATQTTKASPRQASASPAPAEKPETSPAAGKTLGTVDGPLMQPAPLSPVVAATTKPAPEYVNGSSGRSKVTRAATSAPARTVVTASTTAPVVSSTPRQRRPVQETAELADEIEAMNPNITQTELARRLGISATRLRAVRREAREMRRAAEAAERS